MPRIVSLIASSTEIVCALGFNHPEAFRFGHEGSGWVPWKP